MTGGKPLSPDRASSGAPIRALAVGVVMLATIALSGAADGAAAPRRHHGATVCQRRHGHTIMARGSVRVFVPPHPGKRFAVAYGCLRGSTREVPLYSTWIEEQGTVAQIVAPFVVAESHFSNQYGFRDSLAVYDLATGRSYDVATASGYDGASEIGDPGPLSWPLDRFVTSRSGLTVRLYNTYSADAETETTPSPSGETLDVVGFHHFARVLAVTSPGAIDPDSLAFRGDTVTWDQDGVVRSTFVSNAPDRPGRREHRPVLAPAVRPRR